MCVCVRVCARVRARTCACVHTCVRIRIPRVKLQEVKKDKCACVKFNQQVALPVLLYGKST